MLDGIVSKTMYKIEDDRLRKKKLKKLNKVKPIQNISENPLSFLEMSPVQKDVLPSHKLHMHISNRIRKLEIVFNIKTFLCICTIISMLIVLISIVKLVHYAATEESLRK